ncbi:MAG: FAD-dependent oxidoreductase [Burkholderiaceae bacterium]
MNGADLLIGSTYADDTDERPRQDDDRSNLRRFARTLGMDPGPPLSLARSGVVGFRWSARDRMPVIGAVPDEAMALSQAAALRRNERLALPRRPGLYCTVGHGSRGLIAAPLAAAIIAAQLDGAPAPIEADLLESVDPARFLRRVLRRRDPLATFATPGAFAPIN